MPYENVPMAGTTGPASVQPSSAGYLVQPEKLGKLRDAGVLSDEEFAAKKTDIPSRT